MSPVFDNPPYMVDTEVVATSPADRVPNYDDRPGRAALHSEQVVWDAIARDHPRRFRRAVAHLKWLDRLYERYSQRVV